MLYIKRCALKNANWLQNPFLKISILRELKIVIFGNAAKGLPSLTVFCL